MSYLLMCVHSFVCDVCRCEFADVGTKWFVWGECTGFGWTQRDGKHFCGDCSR